jgi:hypothetical protein
LRKPCKTSARIRSPTRISFIIHPRVQCPSSCSHASSTSRRVRYSPN